MWGARAASLMLVLAACSFEVDYGESRFRCSDEGERGCPDGFTCVDHLCTAGGAGRDSGAPPRDARLRSCDEQYGEAGKYILCAEEPDSCRFFAATPGPGGDVPDGTCDDLCAAYGGTCLAADNAETSCAIEAPGACDEVHADQICVCTRDPA